MIEFDTKELAEIVATEGQEGFRRWLKQFDGLGWDLSATESLYWRLKEASTGAAFLLAYTLRFKRILKTPNERGEIPTGGTY